MQLCISGFLALMGVPFHLKWTLEEDQVVVLVVWIFPNSWWLGWPRFGRDVTWGFHPFQRISNWSKASVHPKTCENATKHVPSQKKTQPWITRMIRHHHFIFSGHQKVMCGENPPFKKVTFFFWNFLPYFWKPPGSCFLPGNGAASNLRSKITSCPSCRLVDHRPGGRKCWFFCLVRHSWKLWLELISYTSLRTLAYLLRMVDRHTI